ncbi:MAG: DUF309 domain-containing protein [Synergistales bacterium]|nr:DUF309 domain-containing protein [Synergistales bacterium]
MNRTDSELFFEGIALFNSGKYYECHDLMEYLWGHGEDELRNLYKGILHLAVALYHFRNHNLKGAASLLESGIHLLGEYPPLTAGVDITLLLSNADTFLRQIRKGDLELCRTFDIIREVEK